MAADDKEDGRFGVRRSRCPKCGSVKRRGDAECARCVRRDQLDDSKRLEHIEGVLRSALQVAEALIDGALVGGCTQSTGKKTCLEQRVAGNRVNYGDLDPKLMCLTCRMSWCADVTQSLLGAYLAMERRVEAEVQKGAGK